MRNFILFVTTLLIHTVQPAHVFAQADPQARKDLVALRTAYEKQNGLTAEVALEIKFAEQPAEVQTGTIKQQGEKFRVEFDQQVVISDAETVWMYLPENQEVQVYDATEGDEATGFLKPQDLLTIYDSEDFEYAIVGEVEEEGNVYRQIEFKPVNTDSEYSKVRLTYDASKDEVRRVKVFNKDGSRFTLSLTSVKTDDVYPASTFKFVEKDYPGVMVEDMRL